MMNPAVINGTSLDFMMAPYASLSADELLCYFQTRNCVQYFPLPQGSPTHVERADKILTHEFDFNNEVHRLPKSFDWKTNPSLDIEWLILLHKFYYAKDLAAAYDYTGDETYASKWIALVSSWISQVPDGFIDSQVTGRRLQQWLFAYHYFIPGRRSTSTTPSFLVEFVRSIHSQTLYLREHLTREGNHRTIELYSIFLVAVVFPELREATSLLEFAKQELLKNMEQDLLGDGVHRELSTDYHHTVLKNYLRVRALATLNRIALPPRYDELIHKALEFSIYVHKPDGLIPAINDGDSNSYLSFLKKACAGDPNEHLLYVVSKGKEGSPPRERSKGFSDSGYYVLRGSWTDKPYEDGLYFLFDCGPLGFGSHGHYDLLNFEAAAYGHSLIVDPGRYTYSEDSSDGVNWRKLFKGTAYHNTVVVDGKDQAPYRLRAPIGPEPQATLKTFAKADGFDFIHAQAVSHEYPVVHERMVFFVVPEYWIVTDLLQGEGSHTYDLRFHLGPRAQGQTTLRAGENSTWVSSPNLLIAQPRSSDIQASLEDGFVSPQYGVRQDAPIVKFTQKADETAFFHTVIYPYRTEQPVLNVERLTVNDLHRRCSPTRATALKITIRSETKQYTDYLFMAHEQPTGEYGFDDIVCRSQALFLRKDHSGRIVNLQAEGLDRLQVGSMVLMGKTAGRRRVSWRDTRPFSSPLGNILRMAPESEQVEALSQLVRGNQVERRP
jgi:hypothetical protein